MRPVEAGDASHYTWCGPNAVECDGWHLVRTPELSVIEERMPPDASEVRHKHARAHQFFYVLAGEFIMEVEGEEFALCAGQGIEVAAGQAHQARNRSGVEVRFLVTSQPPSHGDRVPA